MESRPEAAERGWTMPLARWFPRIREREEQVFLALTLVIGALTGLAVVAFIVVTERLGMHLALRARRANHDSHRPRKILLYRDNTRLRNPAWA